MCSGAGWNGDGSSSRWQDPSPSFLLVPQSLDRIESRRADGGHHAEEDADAGGEADANGEGPPGQRDGEAGEPMHAEADAAADEDAEHAAGGRQEDGLEQELP